MKTPERIAVLLLCTLALTIPAGRVIARAPGNSPGTGARPNIVFIFSDDHAYQAIGAYGSVVNETPNIDQIAREGMVFRECYVTNSICGPSRAVILTGKHSHLNGYMRNGMVFDGAQQTFPKLLRKAGYQTAMIGKWHLRTEVTGFDYAEVLVGQGHYYNPQMIRNGEKIQHTGYTTEILTDLALEWLRTDRDPERPFMLMLQHKAPHRNWQPGPRQLWLYENDTIPEPATLFDDWSSRGTAAHTQDMTIETTLTPFDLKFVAPKNLNAEQRAIWDAAYDPRNAAFEAANLSGDDLVRWKYQRYLKDYLRCVAAVDESVGRVLEYLDDTGLASNTIVIYSSDQGFYLGEHGWFDKRWMYEESLRTPLVVRWPGVVAPGSENDDIVSNLDFAETFLDVADVPIPSDMQGRSLAPLLGGETPDDWRDSFYYHYYEFPGAHGVRRHYGVCTREHKLIYFYNLDEWELYDRVADPKELRNVYDDPGYAGTVSRMKTELERLRARYRVPEDTHPLP